MEVNKEILFDKRVRKETYGSGKVKYYIEYVYRSFKEDIPTFFEKFKGIKKDPIPVDSIETDDIEFDNLEDAVAFAKLSQGPSLFIGIPPVAHDARLYYDDDSGMTYPKYNVYRICNLTSLYVNLDESTLEYDEVIRCAYMIIDNRTGKKYYTTYNHKEQDTGKKNDGTLSISMVSFFVRLSYLDDLDDYKKTARFRYSTPSFNIETSLQEFVNYVAKEEAEVFKKRSEILERIADIEKHNELDDLIVSTDYIHVGTDDKSSVEIVQEYEMSQEELQSLANERNQFIIDEINRINSVKKMLISLIK